MPGEQPSGQQRTHTSGLRRDIAILDALASEESDGGMRVSQIARITARDKAQVSRVLTTLGNEGLVKRDTENGKYRLGWKLYSLAAKSVESTLSQEAAPYLREIVAGLQETAHLCVLRNEKILTIRTELAENAFRGRNWQGVSVSPHQFSAGRVLLSQWNDEEIKQWWQKNPPAPTRSIPPALLTKNPQPEEELDLAGFLADVHRVRSTGYALTSEAFEPGLVGVSAPVYDFRGAILAAINVAAPLTRLGSHLDAAGTYVREVASRLSQQLGYQNALSES